MLKKQEEKVANKKLYPIRVSGRNERAVQLRKPAKLKILPFKIKEIM